MVIDKARIIRSAEKHVMQGRISSAISEYRKLCEADPEDAIALNTLGDLYVRQGNTREALRCFDKAAEVHLRRGFGLKAIAVLKKIIAIDPQNVANNIRLAELYAKQGLNAEAKHHYRLAAELYARSSKPEDALGCYRKIAELDPYDLQAQLKLADIYRSQGQIENARDCYVRAGEALVRQGLLGEAISTFEKALDIDPLCLQALRGYLEAARRSGDVAAFLTKLELAGQIQLDNIEMLELLGQANLACGNFDAAARMFLRLLELDESRYENFLKLGQSYYEMGDLDRAAEQIASISHVLVERRESGKGIAFLQQILELDPNHLPSLLQLAELHFKTNNAQAYTDVLARVADIYIEKGEYLEALNVLEKLVQADFKNLRYHRLHRQLFMEAYPDQDYKPPLPSWGDYGPDVHTSELATSEPLAAAPAKELKLAPEQEVDLSVDLNTILSSETAIEQAAEPEAETQPAASDLTSRLRGIDFYIDRQQIEEAQGAQVASPKSGSELASSQACPQLESAIEPLFKEDDVESLIERGLKLEHGEAGGMETGVSPEDISESDFQMRYDLGIAYKEMGLVDDAIASLQLAYRTAQACGSFADMLKCCLPLAACCADKGDLEAAIRWCKLGLDNPALSADDSLALKYELASAYGRLGDLRLALEIFEGVYSKLPTYRDVAQKIEELRRKLDRL